MSWLRGRVDQALRHGVEMRSGVESDASSSFQRFRVRFGTTALLLESTIIFYLWLGPLGRKE